MLISEFSEPLLFGLSAFLSAFAALSIVARRQRSRHSRPKTAGDIFGDTLVFLIADGELLDCNLPARAFLQHQGDGTESLAALRVALATAFENPDRLINVNSAETRPNETSRDGRAQATAERVSNVVRIKITSLATGVAPAEEVHRAQARDSELEFLRETTAAAPFLVWREATDGTPVWVNAAYLELVKKIHGEKRAREWPLPRLLSPARHGGARRVSLNTGDPAKSHWFDCHVVPIGSDTLCTAFDANATIRAEEQLREFMQTLTKTFSQLTIGLAIFDKSRKLALFNPALTELTRLPVDFLAVRPPLVEFLDKLRERKMMPEPKDYRTWRKSIADLEAAAIDGSYSETWSLPGNTTYRVTGRPHPDGAIAFLFEDISAEMTLTRHFRSELEMSQTIIDNLEDATAVFSANGELAQSNEAYRRLWAVDPDVDLKGTNANDASRMWHDATLPSPIWGDFRDFSVDQGDRAEWSSTVTLRDGRAVECRFIPISGGGVQAVFRLAADIIVVDERMLEVV